MTTRLDLDRRLQQLESEVVSLGAVVEKAVRRSVDALQTRDLVESQQVINEDDHIDRKRYEIEESCINLIATQQPMARDLRLIISLQHVTEELERIGDYAEGISKISLSIGDTPPLQPLTDIPEMAEKSTNMLRGSIDALSSRDIIKAAQVWRDDDQVDALYDRVYRALLTYMVQNPRSIQRATYLLWVSHDLERIADRSTNIAERVLYMVTGSMEKPKAAPPARP